MNAVRWFLLGVLAVAVAVALLLQREVNKNLRSEIAQLREDRAEMARLRAEHEKLLAAQPPTADLERLRADRVALDRLRGEIAKMREHADQTEKRLNEKPREAAKPAAALVLPLRFERNGTVSSGGNVMELAAVKSRFAGLKKGDVVEVRISSESGVPAQAIKAAMEDVREATDDLGLRLRLNVESEGPTAP